MMDSSTEAVPCVPPVATASWAAQVYTWLTGTKEAEPAEVKEALLNTLPETPRLQILGSIAVQVIALSTFLSSHATWAIAWMLADVALLTCRRVMQMRHASALRAQTRPARGAIMVYETAWLWQIAAGSIGMLSLGDVRLTVLAAMLIVGIVGYVASRYSAFPRLGAVLVYSMTAALSAGFLLSPLPGMGWMACAAASAVAIHLQVMSNHRILLSGLRAQYENRRLSLHDALTGLPNRAQMTQRLERLCTLQDKADAVTAQFAVLCLDLDDFKLINDLFGHAAGDIVLINTAERMRRAVRTQDTVIRMGGDEFVVLLPAAGADAAVAAALRLIEVCTAVHQLAGGTAARTGASIGIALAPVHGGSPDELLAHADAAMYAVKREGKGGWRLYGG